MPTPVPPEEIQDNVQQIGSYQLGSTGVFEQASIPVYNYKTVTANTDAIKSGQGILHTVSLTGTKSATTITISDSLTHGSGNTILAIATGATPVTYTVDALFTVGLSISDAGSDQVTLTYA